MSDAAGPRTAYIYAILDMPAGPARRAEQSPDEVPLIAALKAYDEVKP